MRHKALEKTAYVVLAISAFVDVARAEEKHIEEQDETSKTTLETVVRKEKSASSASSRKVTERELKPYLLSSPAQLLEAAPGMVTVQHAGGGKANQYFLRGFDLDHGTDLALWVDGVPVNMVSHGHGQGYADLNFVIPETVESLLVNKGPYAAAQGDFATAGSVNMLTKTRFEKSSATFQVGQFQTFRGVAVGAMPSTETFDGYLAAEFRASDGPFLNPERLRRLNVLAKSTFRPSSKTTLEASLHSTGAGWNASGQIPLRAVKSGVVDFFGAINPTDGGSSERHAALVSLQYRGFEESDFKLSVYAVRARLHLFSDFGFFAAYPERGDQIEQTDSRWMTGFSGLWHQKHKVEQLRLQTTMGVTLRHDDIENGLFQTVQRERWLAVNSNLVQQSNLALFAEEEVHWNSQLRTVLGVRADAFTFAVEDFLENTAEVGSRTSGTKEAFLVSPKLSLLWTPQEKLELFFNYGRGFHSNDARGVVSAQTPVTPLATANGYEVGMKSRLFNDSFHMSISAFGLDLASELVWVGDEGTTEAKGPSRRLGVEWDSKVRITTWLWASFDATFTRARFRNGTFVPLALPWTLNATVQATHPSGFFGGLRCLAVGSRPANEEGTLRAQGFAYLDAQVGYAWKNVRFELGVRNLLNQRFRQAQFASESRLPSETSPTMDLHFTPGTPRMVLLTGVVSL